MRRRDLLKAALACALVPAGLPKQVAGHAIDPMSPVHTWHTVGGLSKESMRRLMAARPKLYVFGGGPIWHGPGPDLAWLWYYVTTERFDRKGWPVTGTPRDGGHPGLYGMAARFAARCRRCGLPAKGEGQRVALDMVDRGGVWEWSDEEIERHHPGYLAVKRDMDERLRARA